MFDANDQLLVALVDLGTYCDHHADKLVVVLLVKPDSFPRDTKQAVCRLPSTATSTCKYSDHTRNAQ